MNKIIGRILAIILLLIIGTIHWLSKGNDNESKSNKTMVRYTTEVDISENDNFDHEQEHGEPEDDEPISKPTDSGTA